MGVKRNIINTLKNADVLIYNPIGDKYGFWSSNNFINNLIGDNCLKIKIPYMRSNLYNIGDIYYDLSKFNGKDNRYIGYYNIIKEVIEPFIKNHEPCEKNMHFLIDYYDNFLKDESNIKIIENHFNWNLHALKKHDAKSDVPMYDFIEENFRKHKLFLNYDHPSILYFGELFKRIMKLISKSYSINLKEVKIFDHIEDPIKSTEIHVPKYVKIHGNLTFNDDNIGQIFDGKTWNYKNVLKIICLIKFNKKWCNRFDERNFENVSDWCRQVKDEFKNI